MSLALSQTIKDRFFVTRPNFRLILYLLVFSADITFANSLDPHQAQQNAGPDLGPNSFETDGIAEKSF